MEYDGPGGNYGPEPEPTFAERLDAILFPSSPEAQALNMVIFATVGFLTLALVLAWK
jgi:hypothetical protein